MKKYVLFLLALTFLTITDNLRAQGTAFTYQGQLQSGGNPANGNYDFTFALFNSNSTNTGQVGSTLTILDTGVTNGLFIVTLDFGANFPGANRWLAISVRTNGGGSFTPLSPLQQLTPSPYAIYAPNSGTAASASSVAASNISGTIAVSQLSSAVLTNAEAGVTLTGSFTGDGGGLTNLNVIASQLTSIGNSTGGSDNFFVGGSTGNPTTSGSDNSAFGFQALFNNSSGSDNAAFGLGALFDNNSGSKNTATGFGALNLNTTGSDNTANGFDALHVNTTGSDNTAFGYQALSSTSSSNNIALGSLAGENITTGSSNIDIGNIGVVTDTNIIRIGASQTQAYIAGIINGNGGGLTNLNASQLTGGAVPALTVSNLSISATNEFAPLTLPPSIPASVIGSATTGRDPYSLAVAGRYIYVVNGGSNSLEIFDASVPSAPLLVGAVTTGAFPDGIVVAGRYAYVVNGSGGSLQIFDISSPRSPVSVGSVATGNGPASLAVAGCYAYVVNDSGNTLQIFDVSVPTAPVSVGSVATGTGPNSIAQVGRYAYVANEGSGTLQVFDVSTPTAPFSVGSVATGNTTSFVTVAGRYAYVINGGSNALQIVDVSTPSVPVLVGSVTTGNSPAGVAVAGRYAYVVSDGSVNSVQIVDVSTPTAPVTFGSVTAVTGSEFIAVSGRYGYVLNENGAEMQILDLGGAYIQQFEAGAVETGTLQTRDTATVGNNLNVRGGIAVASGARISGSLSVDNGTITGNGGGLTNLNAAQLHGVLPGISGTNLTSLPASAALLGATQLFSGSNTFAGGFTINTQAGTISVINDGDAVPGIVAANSGGNSGDARFRNYLQIFPNQAQTEAGQLDVRNTGGTATIYLNGANGGITCSNVTASGMALTSDRNAKQNFTPLDPQETLAKVTALPVTEWNYKADPAGTKHIGPMAQDFHAAFGLNGDDEKHISVVDEGGVALAAIQGLNQKVDADRIRLQNDLKQKDAEIEQLKQTVAELRATVSHLARTNAP